MKFTEGTDKERKPINKGSQFFLPANPKNDPKWNTVEARSHAREGVTLDRNSVTAHPINRNFA